MKASMRRTGVILTRFVFAVAVAVLVKVCITLPSQVLGFQIDPIRINYKHYNFYCSNNIQPQPQHDNVLHRSNMKIYTATQRRQGSRRTSSHHNDDDCMDKHSQLPSLGGNHRRHVLRQIAFMTTSLPLVQQLVPLPANAFANKISNQYDDRPKRRGPQPPDLGIRARTNNDGDEYMGLKSCKDAPNCFSSSIPINDDPDHSIPAWVYPKDKDLTMAMEDIYTVIQNYPPGQGNIDGGGFEIKSYDKKNGYIYVQFESLKNGYIDDFEAAYIPPTVQATATTSSSIDNSDDTDDVKNDSSNSKMDNSVQVRSSSRVGYLDYGVNAKRINYIANELRTKHGWTTVEGVNETTHRRYFIENEVV